MASVGLDDVHSKGSEVSSGGIGVVRRVFCSAVYICLMACVDRVADVVGKVQLRRHWFATVRGDLHVKVRGATWVPARVDGGEADRSVPIAHLGSPQECFACGVELSLVRETRVHAECVGMPEFDFCAPERQAAVRAEDGEVQFEQGPGLAIGEIDALRNAVNGEWAARLWDDRDTSRGAGGVRRDDSWLVIAAATACCDDERTRARSSKLEDLTTRKVAVLEVGGNPGFHYCLVWQVFTVLSVVMCIVPTRFWV